MHHQKSQVCTQVILSETKNLYWQWRFFASLRMTFTGLSGYDFYRSRIVNFTGISFSWSAFTSKDKPKPAGGRFPPIQRKHNGYAGA